MTFRTLATKTRSGLLYLLFLSSVLTTVFYCFHAVHFNELKKKRGSWGPTFQTFSGIAPEHIAHLGRLNPPKRLSYTSFPAKKPPGKIRVGCFGDSFTYGSDVADGEDYPSYLAKLLKGNGRGSNIEVINFGNGWHGFHQTFLMWNFIGRKFDLDFVLIGPQSFQTDRDTTFNHGKESVPFYIHSRYVLEGEDVRLVSVPGRNYAEQFENYHAFWPNLAVWRFDRNTLPFLKAIIGKNRELPNPLYYSSLSAEAEALEIDGRLLQKMDEFDGSRFLLMHTNQALIDRANRIARKNLTAKVISLPLDNEFRAARGHMNARGNKFVAEQYFREFNKASSLPSPQSLVSLKE